MKPALGGNENDVAVVFSVCLATDVDIERLTPRDARTHRQFLYQYLLAQPQRRRIDHVL